MLFDRLVVCLLLNNNNNNVISIIIIIMGIIIIIIIIGIIISIISIIINIINYTILPQWGCVYFGKSLRQLVTWISVTSSLYSRVRAEATVKILNIAT